MKTNKYSSYEQINNELEILKLEREINYRRLVLGVKKTKECLKPENVMDELLGSYKSIFSNSYDSIFKLGIPSIIKWISKIKRGN